MDNFKIIYKILKMLEKAMDYEEFDKMLISPEVLGISEARRNLIMEMLVEEDYIKGVTTVKGFKGVKIMDIRISLKGLEYLEDNSFMKKAANIAKGIKDNVPVL